MKWGIWGGLGTIILLVCLGVVFGRLNSIPFFVSKDESVSGLNSTLYYSQPLYLWSYAKDVGVFARVFYLRKSWMPAIGTLWLSGKHDGVEFEPVRYVTSGGQERTVITKAADLNSRVKKGSRIRAMYITGDKHQGLGRDPENNTCEVLPRICQIDTYMYGFQSVFAQIADTERLPIQYMPVVVISSEILFR